MARKPVKKRKQPRKSVKRKPSFDKIVRAIVAKKPKVANPKFKLEIGSNEDPFFINPKTIPQGVALQWVATDVNGDREICQPFVDRAIDGGWKVVKEIRPLKGQTLVWAPTEVARSQLDANINLAKRQMDEARKLFGMDGGRPSPYHGSFPIVGADFVEAKAYESVPNDAPSIDMDVSIQFRVSARWQDAAASLGLDIREYVRRRLLMEPVVLGPCSPALLYENATSNNHVYEPVQLSITRKD